MGDAKFHDGRPQCLYFEAPHPCMGIFKGMAVILEEHGYMNAHSLRAECKDFKCKPQSGEMACCCHCLLFNEPDFANVRSVLKLHYKK